MHGISFCLYKYLPGIGTCMGSVFVCISICLGLVMHGISFCLYKYLPGIGTCMGSDFVCISIWLGSVYA